MKRWASIFLALLTILLPLQPLLVSARQASSLPACCRRNGKHHCAMPRGMAAASSTPERAFTLPPCPWKFSVFTATVAAAGPRFTLASQRVLGASVILGPLALSSSPRARSQSTRAPPPAFL